MTISAQLQITPAADRRGWTRRSLSLVSSLHSSGPDVIIHDLSETGLLIETGAGLAVLDDLEIELPEAGFTPGVVVWNSGRFYGCQYKERISQATISGALLRSPPAPSVDPAFLLRPPGPASAIAVEALEPEDVAEEKKASLSVRLRVILGSALVLWALIIWAVRSLYALI